MARYKWCRASSARPDHSAYLASYQFCKEQLANTFENARFYCVRSSNKHYDNLIDTTAHATPVIKENEFFSKYNNAFDLVVSFSVSTHFDPSMAGHFLEKLKTVSKMGGHLLLTWFLDHPSNPAQFLGLSARLGAGEKFADPSGSLLFALFSSAAVTELAVNVGLQTERISYGTWRGFPRDLKRSASQDIVLLRRPFELPDEFDPKKYLEIHKDVADAGVDPAQHYLEFGYRERRRLR